MGLEFSPENKQKVDDFIFTEVASIDDKSRRELLARVHEAVFHLNSDDATKVARAQARFATLLVGLAEDSTKASERLEKQTDTLISLTRWIVVLTFALFFLTAYLCYKEYRADQHPQFEDQSATQK